MKENRFGGPIKWNRREDKPCRPSADVAALIDAIERQGRANREEEAREDRGKKFRESVTIGLLALTLGTVALQVREMMKVYDPIKVQADAAIDMAKIANARSADATKALIEAQRAWLGPKNVKLSAVPAKGKPLKITLEFVNSGREPGMDVTFDANVFLADQNEIPNTAIGQGMLQFMAACREPKKPHGGSTIYPSGMGFDGSYVLERTMHNNFVTEALATGRKMMLVQGCLSYRTFDIPKYSYFCYFYKRGSTQIQHLEHCVEGNEAN